MKTDRRASQATIMEVAIAAGVSLATVSRTTNHPEKVKPETREKIERIIKEKGYKPNLNAKSLASSKSTTVAVVVPELTRSSIAGLVDGIADCANRRGYFVRLFVNNKLKDGDGESSSIANQRKIITKFAQQVPNAPTEKMMKYFIQKALGKRTFRKPRISVCVPSGVTEVEKKAVEDATYQAGARDVSIIEEPIAAAIGAGIDIAKPCGNMIVDIGGGTTDIAVISLGGTVVSTSIKIAGDDFDEAIVRFMRKKHNLLIGERTAEDIKIKVGTCFPKDIVETLDVRGRNLVTGLPKTVTVSSTETEEALRETTAQIVEAVHSVLEKTPPELAADIADRGIVLTGGGSLIRGLDELIESKTGINTMVAEDPMTCVAIGTGKYVEMLSGMRNME